MINNRRITSGIKHWGLSGYANILPHIKFGVTGQYSSPQSPTISYRQPLAFIVKRRSRQIDNIKFATKRQENENGKCHHTKQHICKPHKPTRNQSLQKSCFLANAPLNNCIFVSIKKL